MAERFAFAKGESPMTGSSEKRERMEAFVEWLLTPESERQPSTRREFAAALNVSTQTLRNYEGESFVVNALASRRRKSFKVAKADRVIEALYRRAVNPKEGASAVSAAKLLLDWMETQTAEMNADAMRDLSEDELKAMLVQMFDKL